MKLISNNLEVPIAGEVWILLDSGVFGGIESHVIELSKGLQASHVHVRVVLVSEYSPPRTTGWKTRRCQHSLQLPLAPLSKIGTFQEYPN